MSRRPIDPALPLTRNGKRVYRDGRGWLPDKRRVERVAEDSAAYLASMARNLAVLGQGSSFHLAYQERTEQPALVAAELRSAVTPWHDQRRPTGNAEHQARELGGVARLEPTSAERLPAQCWCGDHLVNVTREQLRAGDVRCSAACELPPSGKPADDVRRGRPRGPRLAPPRAPHTPSPTPRPCANCGEPIIAPTNVRRTLCKECFAETW